MMPSPFLALALLLAIAALLLLLMAWSDVKTRIIPNSAIVFFALLFIPVPFLVDLPVLLHVATMLVVFLFTFFCFHRKWLGGGDAKLIPAVALWVGPAGILPFLLIMSFGGVLVAMGLMVFHHKRTKGAGGYKGLKLPYGVAIAAAAIAVIAAQYMPPLLKLMEGQA